MTSELPKYLNDQLGVFLNVKQQKWSWLKSYKNELLRKNILSNTFSTFQLSVLHKFHFSRDYFFHL